MIFNTLKSYWLLENLERYYLHNILAISSLQALIIIVLVALSLKQIRTLFAGLDKNAYLWLAVLVGAQLIAAFVFNQPFLGQSDEWEELYSAKLLAVGNIPLFADSFRHGTTWQVILAGFFLKFGFDPEIASILGICSAAMASIAVFHLSYALFQSRLAALAAVFVLIFSPDIFLNTVVYKGKPMIACGFAAVFLTLSVISFRLDDWKMHTAALLTGAFLINIRQDLGIYIMIFVIGFMLLNKGTSPDKRQFLKWLIPCAALSFFGSVYYFNLYRGLDCFYSPGPIQGYCIYRHDLLTAHFLQSIFTGHINPQILMLVNIVRNSGAIFRCWFSGRGLLGLALMILPFLTGARKHIREMVFLALTFALLNSPYLLHNTDMEMRFLIHGYPVFAVLAGYGFSLIAGILKPKIIIAVCLTAVIASMQPMADALHQGEFQASFYHDKSGYKAVKLADDKIPSVYGETPPVYLVEGLDELNMWNFLTERTVVSLQDLSPNLDKLVGLGRYSEKDAADYRMPLEIFGKAQLRLVGRETPNNMVQARYEAVFRQCKARKLSGFTKFAIYELSGCKPFIKGRSNDIDPQNAIDRLLNHGFPLKLKNISGVNNRLHPKSG